MIWSWRFWLGILLLILVLLWLFKGGKTEQFVGLKPFEPGEELSNYLDQGSINRLLSGKILDDMIKQGSYTSQQPITPVTVKSPRTPAMKAPMVVNQLTKPVNYTPDIPRELVVDKATEDEIQKLTKDPFEEWKETKGTPAKYKREKQVCKILQELYGVTFETVRPDWLINPETGEKLEIDCYNDKLRLGCEVNGPHHYHFPSWTGQSYEEFLNVIRKDKFKVDRCDEVGVYLITVPYNVPKRILREYIIHYSPEKEYERQQKRR